MADLAVVQLARLGDLPLPPNGGVDAPQVRQGGCKGQPVQHLHPKQQLFRCSGNDDMHHKSALVHLSGTAFLQHKQLLQRRCCWMQMLPK